MIFIFFFLCNCGQNACDISYEAAVLSLPMFTPEICWTSWKHWAPKLACRALLKKVLVVMPETQKCFFLFDMFGTMCKITEILVVLGSLHLSGKAFYIADGNRGAFRRETVEALELNSRIDSPHAETYLFQERLVSLG